MSSLNMDRAPDGDTRQTEAVDRFLANLDHDFKQEIVALRQVILAADERIAESIKWNAPSFSTGEHFATFNLHARDGVQLVLHRGAKVRDTAGVEMAIPDPEHLLVWRSKDRALIVFRDMADVEARSAALQTIIRAWIMFV